MSGQVSGIMKQLIVFEQLLRRVVRLHTLRTDEALNTETRHQNQPRNNKLLASVRQLCSQGGKKSYKSSMGAKKQTSSLPLTSDHG